MKTMEKVCATLVVAMSTFVFFEMILLSSREKSGTLAASSSYQTVPVPRSKRTSAVPKKTELEEVLALDSSYFLENVSEFEQSTFSSRDLLSVENGAWILPKTKLPKARRYETMDEFNERLVNAIIAELSKAWPPRVSAPFSQKLAARAYGLDLEAKTDYVIEPRPAAHGENASKVAFLFLVGGQSISTEPLWLSFFASDFAARRSSIFVHPPADVDFDQSSFFAPYALPKKTRVRVTWGSLGLVHAELILLAAALRDPLNQRFVLVSETDVPVWPFKCTYDALMSVDKSFVASKRTLERYEMFRFDDASLAKNWRKGSQWFALTRKHAVALTSKRDLTRWYDAHAKRQLIRRKVKKMGALAAIVHIADKPNFADEHYVQTTLAAKGMEDSIIPYSLTFAAFGRENEFTVWGDGAEHDFKLHAAEWHAIQWGSLSWTALDAWHRICDFDLDGTGPLDPDEAELLKRRSKDNSSTSSAFNIFSPFLHNKGDNKKPSRTFRPEPFDPDRLTCSYSDEVPKGSKKHAPCFLFARKLHAEAVSYYGQLLATFFLAKIRPKLADTLRSVRRVQRLSSGAEIQAILANREVDSETVAGYPDRDMKALLSVFPDFFFDPAASRRHTRKLRRRRENEEEELTSN